MAKIIAMIPARLGSKRVKKKNLRLINGKPLIAYIIEVAKKAEIFDEIYINSEAPVFKKVADEYGVKFYQRPDIYSTDQSTNDEFALDFIQHVPGDLLIQLLPTSPLITPQEVREFVDEMRKQQYETLISVENKQIACVYNEKPINFNQLKINPPSQTMIPVQAYATVLMGWEYKSFEANMEKYNCAYHGGDGKIGFFEIRGLSTIDIDREDDFLLAEKVIESQALKTNNAIKYYDEKTVV